MMQVTNAIIWTICVSIIVFICVLWFVICYIGLCKLRRNRRKPPLPVYTIHQTLRGSPPRHWANGGVNHKVDEKLSTLSRYWTIDRSQARKRERSGGSYSHIKRNLRERGQLFEDTEFTTTSRSLYVHKKPHLNPIVWMRPHDYLYAMRGNTTQKKKQASGSFLFSGDIVAKTNFPLTSAYVEENILPAPSNILSHPAPPVQQPPPSPPTAARHSHCLYLQHVII
ncbi:hypothetical protein O3P69_013111 [Scylla paramamosain]|uniref:Uncharacterized protein n=1 Tax=Scylla paramamosain TaxID=85552 RepID=A0AAW0TZF6_SCYPA